MDKIREVNNIANLEFIIQEEQKGLGHAVQCARDFVNGDSFAVLLGDTICNGNPNCTKGLVDLHHQKKASVFSVEAIKPEETKRYGVVSGSKIQKDVMLVNALVEKPDFKDSPSLLGIQGRYVFTPELFDHLTQVSPGPNGEIELTDAMQSLAREQKVYSWTFKGKRYDIGTMKDWFQSHLELSIESEYSSVLNEVLKKL